MQKNYLGIMNADGTPVARREGQMPWGAVWQWSVPEAHSATITLPDYWTRGIAVHNRAAYIAGIDPFQT